MAKCEKKNGCRFWREGIERDPNIAAQGNLVVPYRPSGFQSYKYKLLINYLIPPSQGGDVFPEDALTISERCSLHFMLSSSVDEWERGDEVSTCPNSKTEQRQSAPVSMIPRRPDAMASAKAPVQPRKDSSPLVDLVTNRHSWGVEDFSTVVSDYFEDSRRKRSSCPMEKGVIRTKRYGDVSGGRLLAAVATALAPQQVLQKVMLGTSSQDYLEEELPARMAQGGDLVDNKWAATLAGDLAELIVLQAPFTHNLQLGPGGDWNDTVIPTQYFMRADFTTIAKGFWQATDAEIIGSIDGLVLASEAEKWSEISGSLRLSQLLEMYYSDMGSNLPGYNRACNRKFYYYNHLAKQGKTIVLQTQYFAEVMSLTTPHYFINDTYLVLKSQEAFNAFKQYTPSIVEREEQCPQKWTVRPRLKLNVILDATWLPYDKLTFLMSIGEELDVSVIDGSRIEAVINGKSGAVIVEDATTLGSLYLQWNNSTLMDRGISSRVRSAFGHVTIIIGLSSAVTDWDIDRSQQVYNAIKAYRPEMQFLFVGMPERFSKLLRLSGGDRTLQVDRNEADRQSVVNKIMDYLSYVPRTLRPAECSKNGTTKASNVTYEEYISPEIPHYYKIDPMYLCQHTEYLVIKLTNYGYGSLSACLSRNELEPVPRQVCKHAGPFDRLDLTLRRPCSAPLRSQAEGDDGWSASVSSNNNRKDFPCRPVYVTITGKRSLNKCTEKNCRLPDQIRFMVQIIGLSCVSDKGVTCSAGRLILDSFLIALGLITSADGFVFSNNGAPEDSFMGWVRSSAPSVTRQLSGYAVPIIGEYTTD
ncbi:hypothetical protein AAG570_003804 [Ranatra chinensis]|uniref:Uncharacterized protein n=1 Tax=Ranatra chinensis TaxID=642074 RepID=A0ABD0Y4S5_9HEMI